MIGFPSLKIQNISGAKIRSRKEHLSSPCYITAPRPSAAVWIAGGCWQSDTLHRSLPGLKKKKTALPSASRVVNLSSLLVHYSRIV